MMIFLMNHSSNIFYDYIVYMTFFEGKLQYKIQGPFYSCTLPYNCSKAMDHFTAYIQYRGEFLSL